MKKLLISTFAAVGLMLSSSAVADHHEGKEVTLKGEGMCAKCELAKSDSCASVIQVKNDEGKKEVIWIAKNDVSKDFHSKVCQSTVKLTAVGKVTEKEGKKWLMASKLKVEEKE